MANLFLIHLSTEDSLGNSFISPYHVLTLLMQCIVSVNTFLTLVYLIYRLLIIFSDTSNLHLVKDSSLLHHLQCTCVLFLMQIGPHAMIPADLPSAFVYSWVIH